MAKRPIMKIECLFSYGNNKTKNPKMTKVTRTIIATTTDLAELNSCSTTKSRLAAKVNKSPASIILTIHSVSIVGTYGETTDRF